MITISKRRNVVLKATKVDTSVPVSISGQHRVALSTNDYSTPLSNGTTYYDNSEIIVDTVEVSTELK
jgi:hypothetical protein